MFRQGFSRTLNAILENLRHERQTLLFSATQTRSVKDLARLSLKDPEYIAVHADTSSPTPVKLRQGVTTCEAHEKLDMLWSFIRSHLLCKTICFLSTCKEVRFVYEAFKRLRPGVPLRMLHGKMKQMRRMSVFHEFCEAKEMVLFATDIASRGLDFPAVDWVLQMDCPEDVAQYIHRVGRTARFTAAGHALLYLTPGEMGMLQQLQEKNITMTTIKVNPSKLQPVTPALQALVSKSTELKQLAQRALVSYLRSVFLAPNKAVFDVASINVDELAPALGLMVAPKLKFMKRAGKGTAWNTASDPPARGIERASDDGDVNGGGGRSDDDANAAMEHDDADAREIASIRNEVGDDDDDDEFLAVKKHVTEDSAEVDGGEDLLADRGGGAIVGADIGSKKRKKMKIKVGAPTEAKRVVFDDEGNVRDPLEMLALRHSDSEGVEGGEGGVDVGVHEDGSSRMRRVAEIMRDRDREDKRLEKIRRKEVKAAKKERRRNREAAEGGGEAIAVLGGRSDDDGRHVDEEPTTRDAGSSDGASDGDEEEATVKPIRAVKRARAADDISAMSVADQQRLALQLLQRKRRA